jgi:imidazolonepropionase-like amidohydrolase
MIIPHPIRASRTAAAALLVLAACQPTPKDRVALVGATIIDGTGGQPQRDMVVVVHGTRIESVVPRAGFKLPKTAVAVDVSDRWIIPGLIDAHAHTTRWALPRYLAFGVTTVRDVHSRRDSILALRDQANLGGILAPRLYIAGSAIDGRPPTFPDAAGVQSEDEARRAVDTLVLAGVDLIKTYTRITPPLLRAIVDEAGTFRVPVTAHLGLTDAVTAAKLGVRSIEHLSGIPEAASKDASKFYAAHRAGFFQGWNYTERSWAGLDSTALARVAEDLVRARVVMVPTLVLHDTYSRLDDPALLLDPGFKAVPPEEMNRWNLPDLKARAGWTAADYVAFRNARPVQDLFLRVYRAAGGRIVAGTDAANQMLVPGLSEHQELKLLVEAGLTPYDAIQAATRNAAELIGADSLGTVAPGQSADLVVLTANPLENIENTAKIERVMVRGLLLRADSIRSHW